MEDNSFYVLCPSNASTDLFEENNPASFKISVPKRIHLQGQYEVGLVEIQYPVTWDTFHKPIDYRIKVQSSEGNAGTAHLTQTKYDSANELVTEICFKLGLALNKASDFYRDAFVLDFLSNRVIYNVQKYNIEVRLSSQVIEVLGLQERAWIARDGTGNYPPDHTNGFNALYVYCYVVQPQIVGNVYAPLLRTVGINNEKRGDLVQRLYDQPHYVPVNTDELSIIEINIKDDTGQNISFASGKVICKLHFRQKLV